MVSLCLCASAACRSPPTDTASLRSEPVAAPPGKEPLAQSSAGAPGVEGSSPAPVASEADAGTAEGSANSTTVGSPRSAPPFDPRSAPRSKIELIDALDQRLRGQDAQLPDGQPLVDDCRGRSEDAATPSMSESLLAALGECKALTDYKHARRLALNFGTREEPYDARCAELLRLEKSELFYGVGDEVFKVTLHAVALRGGYAVRALRCTKKGGSPRDFDRLRVNCPGRPWFRVTQSGGVCP